MVELDKNPYFYLINNPNKEVRASNVTKYANYAWDAINCLMRLGKVYRQGMLFEDDSILFYVGQPVCSQSIEQLKAHEVVIGSTYTPWRRR